MCQNKAILWKVFFCSIGKVKQNKTQQHFQKLYFFFSGESKQLADPDVLKRLTSSVRYHLLLLSNYVARLKNTKIGTLEIRAQ